MANAQIISSKQNRNLSPDREINYVYSDPIKSLDNAIRRAKRIGRTVPSEAHIDTHIGSFETIKQLNEIYKDNPNVAINLIDNTGEKEQSKSMSFDELNKIDYISKEDLKNKINEHLDKQYSEGKLTESEYKGFKGEEGKTAGGNSKGNAAEKDSGIERPEKPRQEQLAPDLNNKVPIEPDTNETAAKKGKEEPISTNIKTENTIAKPKEPPKEKPSGSDKVKKKYNDAVSKLYGERKNADKSEIKTDNGKMPIEQYVSRAKEVLNKLFPDAKFETYDNHAGGLYEGIKVQAIILI